MITFNMQTYGLLPVGTKHAAPPASTFNPDKLDTDTWAQAAKSFGAKYAVLTASHRSGFALWPTKSHNYSVASSALAGHRDVLREFVSSCRKFGLSPGVFWTQRFNDYFGVAGDHARSSTFLQPLLAPPPLPPVSLSSLSLSL
jgi:alpha-L-fucosidase